MFYYDGVIGTTRLKYITSSRIRKCFVVSLVLNYIWNPDWKVTFSYTNELNLRLYSRNWSVAFSSFFLLVFFVNLSIPSTEAYRRASGLPPQVINSNTERMNAFVGQTLWLTCAGSGNPPPERSWYKDGEQIGLDWKRFRQKRARLRIRNITLADSGLYTCLVVNGFGTSEKKTRLVVQGKSFLKRRRKRPIMKPVFSQPIKMRRNVYVKPAGGAVNFRCKAKGKPRPKIRWYKDGNLTEPVVNSRAAGSPWTLTLRDIRVRDSGRYTCRVWNSAGEISFDYVLRVVGSNIHERPLLLPPHPVNTTVRKGERGSLLCNVRSTVPPTVKWIKKLDQATVDSFKGKWPNNSLKIDEKLYLILPPQQMIKLVDGSYLSKLILNDVTPNDSGMYICLGANTMGYSFRYAYLTVLSDERHVAVAKESLSSLSIGIFVGVPSLCGVFLVIFILLKCIRNYPNFNKSFRSSHQTSVARSINRETLCLQATNSSTSAAETLNRDDIVRIVHSDKKGNYVNPTHTGSCCGSEASGKSKRAPAGNSLLDVNESDIASTCVSLPPPPPPSQYSHSSSYVSSSSYSGRYKSWGHRCRHHHHHHHHRYRSPPSSQYSNGYDDF